MKPNLRLSVPNEKSSSAFFVSPYPNHPRSQLSPIPDASPLVKDSDNLDNIPNNVQPSPSPSMIESSIGSYPFPTEHGGGGSIWTRARVALAGKGAGRGTALRRILWLVLFAGLLLLVYHSDRAGITLGTRRTSEEYSSGKLSYEVSDESDYEFGSYPIVSTVDVEHITDSHPVHKLRPPTIKPASPAKPASHPPSGGSSSSIYSGAHAANRREIDIASDPLPVEASLRERLDAWRDAPGGRGEVEGEVELGGFVRWNLEQCDTIEEQHNTHMIQKSANVWATMNRTTLHNHRMTLIDYMETVIDDKLTDNFGEGRGIVTVAGNADTLTRVKWSLLMLRSYGSTLPVQIYHFPSESPDEEDPIRYELEELGATLVEAQGQQRDEGKTKSYHLKAIAVVQCPWREVLYLDSDSIPTRDPEYMFDAPNFKRLGIWATPDYWKTSANNPIWAIAGVKCRNEWEMETGQVFVDKKLHLDVFLLVKYMLENHDWWFFFSDGDKDIFRWALLMLRKRWGVPGRWVGAGALPSGTASGEFCAHTMMQHDSWGEPLFVHYNLLKQIPSGVGRGFSWGRTKQLPMFNTFPATPATARLGEPVEPPVDFDRPGLGDIDCDMLADADEYGVARAPAQEMIMRRAVRERGVKVRYHGGWISALCIDLDYIDPRPDDRKEIDKAIRAAAEAERAERDQEWEAEKERAKEAGRPEPERPAEEEDEAAKRPVRPDWEQSPLEVVQWRDDEHLSSFEQKIYDFGFKPSGPGF